MHTIREAYPCLGKLWLNISLYDPSIFKRISGEFFLPPDTSLEIDKFLNRQKNRSYQKFVCEWITEISRPFT